MQTITIDLALLIEICGLIAALGGAAAILKRWAKPLIEPVEDMQGKIKDHEKMLANDKKRLDDLDKIAKRNDAAIDLLLETQKAILAHLQTGNATNKMSEAEAKIDAFLIKSRN